MQILERRPEVRASKKNGRQQDEHTGLGARRKWYSIQLRDTCCEETNKKKPKHELKPRCGPIRQPQASRSFDEKNFAYDEKHSIYGSQAEPRWRECLSTRRIFVPLT